MNRETGESLPITRFCALAGALLLWGAAVLFGAGAVRLNADLQGGDQGAYLQLALDQKEGRALTDGNRHPLYSALLVPLAERKVAFFARARWISLGLGAAFLLVLGWLEWKKGEHPFSAFFALAFLGVHTQMYRTLSEIWCEPLLYPLVFFLWWGVDRWGRSPSREAAPPEKKEASEPEELSPGREGSLPFWIGMGVIAGSIYLTKGTGLQIAALFFLTALLFARQRKKSLLALVAFLVVISPLAVWNVRTYGDPLYSFASTHNMWFDEADEIWYDDPATLPTLGSYLRSHTPGEILARLGRGILLESRMAFELLWSVWTTPLAESFPAAARLFLAFKVFFYGMVLWGVFACRSGREAKMITSPAGWVFFALLAVAFFLTFGWYAQLTNAPRFLMTLVPIAAVLLSRAASIGVVDLLRDDPSYVGSNLRRVFRTLAVVLLGTAPVLLLGFAIYFAVLTAKLPPPQVTPLAERVLDRLERLPEEVTIAYGPSHGLPLWMARAGIAWRPTPWRISFADFRKTLEREDIRYVLVNTETMFRREYLRFLIAPDSESKTGWKLLFRDRDPETSFLLFEVEEK